MACFTKNQQRNGTNCQFEKYVTTSNYFVLNSLDKGHLNSVCTHYVCDKSENARVCAKWQWNALDWCYWIARPASPGVQSSNTVSCVSLSFRTHPCVLAIKTHQPSMTKLRLKIDQIKFQPSLVLVNELIYFRWVRRHSCYCPNLIPQLGHWSLSWSVMDDK